MQNKIRIGKKSIGAGEPVFVIAEAGVNHNGDVEIAMRLIDVAVAAGADAVKFQSFKAESLVTGSAPKADYQLRTTSRSESQLEMLQRLELSPETHRKLWSYCRDKSIMFLSTPFDEESADLLETLDVAAFKLSSGDLTNSPLLEHVARKAKPLILSTGMATLAEVREAVEVVERAGCNELALLHCVSNYPSDPAETNLRAMNTLENTFGVPVGFSDHTEGASVALAAVALGASVVEKHFTLDRNMPGPDHRASLEPDELSSYVRDIRVVEASLGSGEKVPTAAEIEVAKVARRSLIASVDIPAGTVITKQMISLKRPGTGLSPAQLDSIVGRSTIVDIPGGSLLTTEMFG